MDREIIENAVSDYSGSLWRIAYTYTRNACDAEDIVQDTFLSMMTAGQEFESQEHMKAWLIRVTINKSKNHLKSAWTSKRAAMPDQFEALPHEENELEDAIFSLDEKYRIPLHLFYYEGYSIAEIAEIMQKKPSTIGSQLNRGRKKLKKQLEGENKTHLPLYGMILFFLICAVSLTCFHSQDSDILSEKENMEGVTATETLALSGSSGLFEVYSQTLSAGEMLIFDCGETVSKGEDVSLSGSLQNSGSYYDIGYILNGQFSYVQQNISADSFDYRVAAEEDGEFYWCIINVSDNMILFDARIQYDSNDLVFRDYGNDTFYADSSCTIRLCNIQTLLSSKEIKGIYLYNYNQDITTEFSADTTAIEYEVSQPGTYGIYAVTEDGEAFSLGSYVSIDYDTNLYP